MYHYHLYRSNRFRITMVSYNFSAKDIHEELLIGMYVEMLQQLNRFQQIALTYFFWSLLVRLDPLQGICAFLKNRLISLQ
jgi:hypothetical protein